MPIQNQIRILSFTHVGKSGHFLYLYSQQCQSTLFQYFGQYIEIFWKKYSLALLFAEGDPDPDWQALDADPDPAKLCRNDRIQNLSKSYSPRI